MKKKIKKTQTMMYKWKKLWLVLQISIKLFQIAAKMTMMMKKKKQTTQLMKQTVKKKMVDSTKTTEMQLQITYWQVRAKRTK